MTSRQHCKYIKSENGAKCPNRDSIVRAPLIPGQECRHFLKKYYCPYYVVGASDAEVREGFNHEAEFSDRAGHR